MILGMMVDKYILDDLSVNDINYIEKSMHIIIYMYIFGKIIFVSIFFILENGEKDNLYRLELINFSFMKDKIKR